MSRARIELTFDGKTRVYTAVLREVNINSDYADVTTYGGEPFSYPTEMKMQLELMNVKEEYEFDAPDEQ
jgi:hypothetical protein